MIQNLWQMQQDMQKILVLNAVDINMGSPAPKVF
jgi:hypothetical protein